MGTKQNYTALSCLRDMPGKQRTLTPFLPLFWLVEILTLS